MSQILRKTPKGQREIETREHRLAPRLRSALIIIDGRRSTAELLALLPPGADATLKQLLGDGFVEPAPSAEDVISGAATRPGALGPATAAGALGPSTRPGALGPPTQPAALGGATVPGGLALDVQALRRDAVRVLTDAVGPMAEALALRMERARTLQELLPLLATARQIIGNTRGAAAAKAYGERFGVEPPAS